VTGCRGPPRLPRVSSDSSESPSSPGFPESSGSSEAAGSGGPTESPRPSDATGPFEAAGPSGFELGTDGPTAILAGFDDTVTGGRALAYAAGLARRQRAHLVAVYVVPVASVIASAPAGASLLAAEAEAQDEIAGELRARVQRARSELGVAAEFVLARGDAYTEIKRVAAETRADAIVVGASAKAGHRLVGSLAVRLVRAGKWPVTVVP
jgi:nucleotide-binding universal stress UspA family protein